MSKLGSMTVAGGLPGEIATRISLVNKKQQQKTRKAMCSKSPTLQSWQTIYEGERNKASSFRLVRFVVVVVVLGGCLYWDKVEMEYYLGTDLTPHGYCMGTKIRWSILGEQI